MDFHRLLDDDLREFTLEELRERLCFKNAYLVDSGRYLGEVHSIGCTVAGPILEEIISNVSRISVEESIIKKQPQHIRDFGMLLLELAVSPEQIFHDTIDSKFEYIAPVEDEPVT